MPKNKLSNLRKYELQLKRMIKARTGKECEVWLEPQIHITASNMEVLDKVHDELMSSDDLVTQKPGSMAQMKDEVNPLLAYYDKMSRTLLLQFEALGLNYNTTPKKVTENTKQGGTEQDKLIATLDSINGIE